MNCYKLVLAYTLLGFTSFANANLITNGGFEASNSQTTTPTGWTNIGHKDGVIAYSQFGPAAYEGLNFYDLGGFGNVYGPIGDGIAQSFATIVGTTYDVIFGLSSENDNGNQTLTVTAGETSLNYFLAVSNEGAFQKAFTTQNFSFIALDLFTTLSFIHTEGQGGLNDAMIDNVIVEARAENPGLNEVPLPGAIWLFGSALLGFAGFNRKKSI